MTISAFPTFSPAILEQIATNTKSIIMGAPAGIRAFLELQASSQTHYVWERQTTKQFKEWFQSTKPNSFEFNIRYWADMLGNYRLFSAATGWRLRDTMMEAVQAANVGNVISAAILARAAIELSANYAHSIEPASRGFTYIAGEDLRKAMIVDQNMENECVRALFSSRMTGVPAEEKSVNIVTILRKIAKKTASDYITDLYALLCEFSHPNVWGIGRYESPVLNDNNFGTQIRYERDASGVGYEACLMASIEGLGWAAHVMNYYDAKFRDAVKALEPKLQ